jgi:alpha-amylase
MPWGDRRIPPGAGKPRDEDLRRYYLRVVAARNAHPALRRGAHETLSADGDLLVFQKRDAPAKDAVVVAVNRGTELAVARFVVPPEWSGAEVRDLLRDAPVPYAGGRVELTLNPRTAVVLAAGGRAPWRE